MNDERKKRAGHIVVATEEEEEEDDEGGETIAHNWFFSNRNNCRVMSIELGTRFAPRAAASHKCFICKSCFFWRRSLVSGESTIRTSERGYKSCVHGFRQLRTTKLESDTESFFVGSPPPPPVETPPVETPPIT